MSARPRLRPPAPNGDDRLRLHAYLLSFFLKGPNARHLNTVQVAKRFP